MSDPSPAPGAAPGGAPLQPAAPATPAATQGDPKAYWRANIQFVTVLLLIWFTVSCVCSIFLVEWLNQFHLAGFPLGFWFSQQGSVIVFILLILTYSIGMGIIDRRFGVEEHVIKLPDEDTDAGVPASGSETTGNAGAEGAGR